MLLLDENLSWRIVHAIESEFPNSRHVNTSGLDEPIKDLDIWRFAEENKYTIVTNDEDFLHLLMRRGFPPKVILLKIGNKPTNVIAETLVNHKANINEMIDSDVLGILEIY